MSVIEEIAAERRRQIEVEGWTPEHDDAHASGDLAKAAAVYAALGSAPVGAMLGASIMEALRKLWPWSLSWLKPKDERRNLVIAGALILAEIERLDRAKNSQEGRSPQGALSEADRSRIDAAQIQTT